MTHPAIAYLVSHQYEAGATVCEQAIAIQPDSSANYWYLGLIRLLQGDEAEAQAVWFSALTNIDPTQVDHELQMLLHILHQEADRQLHCGKAHLAERIYQQVIELDGSQSQVYLRLGEAVCLQGKLDAAIAYWQIATQLQPDLWQAYGQQAEVFQRLEQWGEAIAAYQQAIALQPNHALHYNLALCLGQQHHWSAALEHLNQTLALQPDFASAYGDRGWVHWQLHQWTAATQDFQAALQTYSNYAQVYHQWVAQLQQANLPVSDCLHQNAAQLQTLCGVAEPIWQHGLEPDTQTPSSPAPAPAPAAALPSADYWLDTQSWVAAQGVDIPYVELDSPSVIRLNPPKTSDRAIHFSFRLEHEILLPGTFVVTIPNGRFWLSASQASTAIFTAANELLGDLSFEYPLLSPGHPDKHPSHHSGLTQLMSSVHQIDGTVAVLAGLTNDVYFHWMVDLLPRVDLLYRSGIDIESIDYFLVSAQLPFQQASLQRLGIPSAKILETNQHLHIQATQLVVPSYPSSPAWMTQRVCEWLKQVFLSYSTLPGKGCDRLYITRQHATNRRLINELAVIEVLEQYGFQTVALESLSIQAQAHLLASARIVISAHGGGLTNLVFCQPGTKVIEIFSPNFVYPCYWLISNLLDLDYYYLTGNIPTGYFLHQQFYSNPRTEDIWVNLDELKHTLDIAGVTV